MKNEGVYMAKKLGELLKDGVLNEAELQEAASRSLARVHQHVHGREIGIISAHRGEHSAEENNHAHAALGDDIKKAGYGHIPIKGHYIENHGTEHARKVSEKSYMVIGGHKNSGLHKFLTKHGEKYKQDSILHKPHDSTKASLHGTKEGSWPGKGEKHEVGEFHPNRTGEFHSGMKGKRTFAFEGADYLYYNQMGFFSRKEKLFE